MDERPTSWNHQYEQLNIPLSPNYQPWGGLFWGDGGETWTRKSGGWSPPTQLLSHLPLLQCYPGVLPHPTVQYITTSKLQINFRIGVVWLILVLSQYSIKVAHLILCTYVVNSRNVYFHLKRSDVQLWLQKQIAWQCWSEIASGSGTDKRARMFDQFLVVLFVYVDCQISACSTWWQNSDASQVAPKLVCNGLFWSCWYCKASD